MKKLMAVIVFAVVATAGLSSRVDARTEQSGAGEGPTDAQVEAALDAQTHEVLGRLLESQRAGERMATLPR
ncbi:hypothetical protein JGU66_00465 [Myxococcaceae bacterium JPH2]|nr:hypothetical protein [Myxococcaceae bacterium JPH2]